MFILSVAYVRKLAPDLFELALERNGYVFMPGEIALLYNDREDSRPYSFASGIDEGLLRFLIRRMDDGAVTNWLIDRNPGELVRVSTPYGFFRPGAEGLSRSLRVFIASGVGIAPFLCYLHSVAPMYKPICLYGVRVLMDAVAVEFLEKRTCLRLALSREEVSGLHHGRVTDLLLSLTYEPDTHFFLCGLDAMVDEVASWLSTKSVDAKQVHTEVFFSSK